MIALLLIAFAVVQYSPSVGAEFVSPFGSSFESPFGTPYDSPAVSPYGRQPAPVSSVTTSTPRTTTTLAPTVASCTKPGPATVSVQLVQLYNPQSKLLDGKTSCKSLPCNPYMSVNVGMANPAPVGSEYGGAVLYQMMTGTQSPVNFGSSFYDFLTQTIGNPFTITVPRCSTLLTTINVFDVHTDAAKKETYAQMAYFEFRYRVDQPSQLMYQLSGGTAFLINFSTAAA